MLATLLSLALAAPLDITVTGVESDQGQLIVAACNDKAQWLELDQARAPRLPASPGTTTVRFDVPAGTWAVWVFHDRNDNGVLDMHWLPIPGPDEPTGVSGGARPRFGPPRFADATFQVDDASAAVEVAIE